MAVNVRAFQKPDHAELPDFDKRSPANAHAAERKTAAARIKSRLPRVHIDYDPILKTPKAIVARDGFLTGPKGRGRGAARETVAAVVEHGPLQPLKGFLEEHENLFGHEADALDRARLKRQHIAPHSGLRSYAWQQEWDGLTVFDAVLSAHITKEGELVSISSQFLGDLEAAAARPKGRTARLKPEIQVEEALLRAAENIGEEIARDAITPLSAPPMGNERLQGFKLGHLPGEAEARLVWLPTSGTTLRLSWQVELTRRAGGERFRVLVDAETGEVVLRHCLTRYLAEASYRVHTSDSPSPFSPGHPTPNTNQPTLVPRTLVTLAALSTNASPTGWIHPADNETRGNNVDAHLDRNGDDLPDLPRPQGSPFRVFDFPMDLAQPPSSYGDAAVAQLFYWCNWMHDTLYDLGFTESAGNYQKDNFGRGGLGNDLILADAQDGSGTDNANFTPSPDGKPARIQMYVFTGPTPDRDGDFDAEIIIHEYVHGLSERLVGGGGGLNALQSGGMGEGWSDFYALALLAESTDDPHAAYAMGGYATESFFGLKENYYFGIRRYPYSTDLLKNPLTFKDIDPTQISPHEGVPMNPIDEFNPQFAAEVHNSGEVWCVTLWEMRANLVAKHGFAGNRLALQIVTDGMKLTPRNPNFLQARDAIILADQVNNGGANFNEIWRAFAKRGMGFSATSPDASTTVGIVEAYDLPDALLIVPSEAFVAAAAVGQTPAPACKTYLVTNHTATPITWSAAATQPWVTLTPSGGAIPPGTGTVVSVCLNTAEQLGVGSHAATITFSNQTTGVTQEREVSVSIMAFTGLPFTENFESGVLESFWQVTGTGDFRAQVTDQNTPRGERHLTLDNTGNGVNSRNEVTLGLDLAGYTNVVLTFWAKQFGDEPDGPPPTPFIGGADFDGVAISADGIRWYEVQSLRALPANYSELRVDLDEAMARYGLTYNQNFRIRFNAFDNFSIPLDGIAIDDIRVTGQPARRLEVNVPATATEGDAPVPGVVTLGAPRPTDLPIALASSDAKVTVPAQVILPAGATQAVFNLTIVDNLQVDGSQTAIITAAAAGFFARAGAITVHDNETNSLHVSLAQSTVLEGDGVLAGIGLIQAIVAPARDVRVTLTSSHVEDLRLPDTVLLRAGECCAEFDVEVIENGKLDGLRNVTIRAQVENWNDGVASIEVEDNDVPGLTLVLPPSLSEGNGVRTNAGRVQLSATLPNDLTVDLGSLDTSEIVVPPSVTVVAGRDSAEFDITVIDDADTDGTQIALITASASGHATTTNSLDVLDDETPPVPYQPQPAHQATGVPITTGLAWFGGVGEIVRNGGFESGNFSGWGIQTTGLGGFAINDGKFDPQSIDGVSPPFAGKFSAVTDQTGGGHHVLYQDLFIPADARGATLSWVDKIRNHSTQYDFNQFFRVEIRDIADEPMEVVFTTQPGFPLTNNWTLRSYDLTRYRGQTVRIAFVEEDHQGYFNIHLDDVSVRLDDNGVTTFDVYFSTNSTLTSEHLLGTTVSNAWVLPELNLNTTYFWQIVSRRGAASTVGPVWEFTTRGVGNLDHFEFGPIAPTQFVNLPFPASLTARDDINNIETNFAGSATLRAFKGASNLSAIVITEIDPGNTDRIEFMNVSGRRIDISNWQISAYDTRSWPAPRSTITIGTNTTVPHGGLFLAAAVGTAPGRYPQFFMGTNLVWGLGAVSNYIAVLVRDASGEVVDFVCAADANAAQISAPVPISQSEWSGLPIAANTNASLTYQRTGSVDTGAAADWVLATNSIGRRNDNLTGPFTPRFPVQITPNVISNFTQGVWSGELAFADTAPAITVIADDGNRHFGFAGPFLVTGSNDISIVAMDVPDVVTLGDDLTYRFTIANSGPGIASAVTFSNQLPAELEFVSATSSQGACALAGTAVLCELGDLAVGGEVVVTVLARTLQTGMISNTGFIARTDADGFDANNRATAESTIAFPVIASGVVSVSEGNSGSVPLTLVVRLSPPSRLPVSVNFRTVDVTATAGVDYAATNGVLTFAPGVTNMPVTVTILGDRLDESSIEQFSLEFSAPVNCRIATPAVRGRINDDDATPLLNISDAAIAEPPPGETAQVTFEVRLSAPSGLTVFVNYATTNGTALAGRDYFSQFGQLEFPPGITNQSFSVPVIGDTIFESNEVFSARLFGAVSGLVSDGVGAATISDNGFVDLDHFQWAPITSPQIAGEPFLATVTARDGRGELFGGFDGAVRVSGISASRVTSIGAGTNTWEFPMGTFYHDSRAQVIYLANEIGAAGKINALALNILTAPGQAMSNWTIRLKHTGATAFGAPAWDLEGWTTVYRHDETIQGVGWTTFFFDEPFDYDGVSHLLVDFSFDNETYTTDGICASFITPVNRSLAFQTDGAFGDPTQWMGNYPPATMVRRAPQVRFTIENFVTASPIELGPFINGTWTGEIAVLEPGTNVVLRAQHDSGRNGSSAGFAVDADDRPPRLAITRDEPDVRLRFRAAFGRTYRVEASDSVSFAVRRTVGQDISGTGSEAEILDPDGALRAQQFYRAVVVP